MKLLKFARRRTLLSEASYIFLNIAYAGLLFGIVYARLDPPYLAFIVVLLSKWRVFAVRPRFWFANMQANLLDTILGLSVVSMLIYASDIEGVASTVVQLVITVLYIGWLLFIKPRGKREFIVAQAGIMQFVAFTALFSVAYMLPVSVVVLLGWAIAYTTARHVLASYDQEVDRTILSLIWGFVGAQMSWVLYYWTVAYTVVDEIKIPNIAIYMTLLSIIASIHYDRMRKIELGHKAPLPMTPLVFSIILLFILVVVFGGLNPSQLTT